MSQTPVIHITLYDPETNEVRKSYDQMFIPWRILKAALRLLPRIQQLENDQLTEEILDDLAGLVVEAFGNRFSVDDLTAGADVGEMATVILAIVNRANTLMPANPTRPGR
jgi:hypothetical protein